MMPKRPPARPALVAAGARSEAARFAEHGDDGYASLDEPATESVAVEVAQQYEELHPGADGTAVELGVRLVEDLKVYLAALDRFYAGLGLTGSYARFGVLRTIYCSEAGRLQHHELSSSMRASTANVSKLVTRLENEGLVRRVPNEPDRRISWVELTAEGEAVAEQVLPANARFFEEVLRDFTPEERETMIGLLEKLRMAALTFDPELE